MKELTKQELNKLLETIDEMYEHYNADLDEFIDD